MRLHDFKECEKNIREYAGRLGLRYVGAFKDTDMECNEYYSFEMENDKILLSFNIYEDYKLKLVIERYDSLMHPIVVTYPKDAYLYNENEVMEVFEFAYKEGIAC